MSNRYYQKHKEKLRKEAHERRQNLCEEQIDKSWKKVRERYKNLTEEEKGKNVARIFLTNKIKNWFNMEEIIISHIVEWLLRDFF